MTTISTIVPLGLALIVCLAALAVPVRSFMTPPFRMLRSPFQMRDLPNGRKGLENFELLGSSVVAENEQGHSIVRLTLPRKSQQGMVYTSTPAEGKDWTTSFEFYTKKSGHSKHNADGIAMTWMLNEPLLGPLMGMREDFQGISVIIDDFPNSGSFTSGYVYAIVSDGSFKYDADKDGKDQEITRGCKVDLTETIRVIVTFKNNVLAVHISVGTAHPYVCFRTPVNLPFLVEETSAGYFALSAMTGYFYGQHDVTNWKIDTEIELRRQHRPVAPDDSSQNANQNQQQQQVAQPDSQQYQQNQEDMLKRRNANRNMEAMVKDLQDAERSLEQDLDDEVKDIANTISGSAGQFVVLLIQSVSQVLQSSREHDAELTKSMQDSIDMLNLVTQTAQLNAEIREEVSKLDTALDKMVNSMSLFSRGQDFLQKKTQTELRKSLMLDEPKSGMDFGSQAFLIIFIIGTQVAIVLLMQYAKKAGIIGKSASYTV